MNIFVSNPINRRYLTGINTSAGAVLIFDDIKYFITDFRYIENCKAKLLDFCVLESQNIIETVNLLIKKHNIKTIHIEDEYLTFAQYNKIILNCTIKPLGNYFSKIRNIKTDLEIEKMQTAQKIAEKALDNILDFIKIGISEKQIKARLIYEILKLGGEDISFAPIVASGANSSMPHADATDKLIMSGEFILLDFGVQYDGYCSDMTRTIATKCIDTEMQENYNLVLFAQQKAINYAKAGVLCKNLDKVARDILKDYNFGHSLGHGIGLLVHEDISISQNSKQILEKGNVITIEPGIYIQGKYGIRIEDMIVITNDGYKNLTNYEKSLILC